MNKKLAVLRENKDNGCPFNLPIPLACKKVGKAILEMRQGENNEDFFIWKSDGNHCLFAKKIINDYVDCAYDTDKNSINPSPLYQKPFSGSIPNGIYTFPHSHYGNETPMNSGPYYGMYGIESVAKDKK